jgi:hypothetical protein
MEIINHAAINNCLIIVEAGKFKKSNILPKTFLKSFFFFSFHVFHLIQRQIGLFFFNGKSTVYVFQTNYAL